MRRRVLTPSVGSGVVAAAGARRLAQLAALLGAALCLWLVEASLLPGLPIPGAKLGFANIVTLVVIVGYGLSESVTNVSLRVLLGSLITGTVLSPAFMLALVAGTAAAAAMYAVWRWQWTGLSLVGVSVVGSIVHTLAQLLLAALLLGTWAVWLQTPALLLVGTLTGCFNGLVAWHLAERLDLRPALR